MVNEENFYQEYKGHTKCLSLISSQFPKNIHFFHIRPVRVWATRKCLPILRPWPPLKTTFSTWAAPKTPFSKINNLFHFSDRPDKKDPCLKKYTFCFSLLFLAPKPPVFPLRGRPESLPFLVRGGSPSHQFLNSVRHIYANFIFEYPLGVCAKYQKTSVKALVQVDFLMYALS